MKEGIRIVPKPTLLSTKTIQLTDDMRTENLKRLITGRLIVLCSAFTFACTASYAQFGLGSTNNATAVALRDPARQASTEVDAAVYNPAGTAFLQEGFHISLNGMYANQPLFSYEKNGEKAVNIHDERILNIAPTAQLAWKKGRFSLSASFADEGYMGKWTCNNGSIPYDAFLQELIQSNYLKSEFNRLNTSLALTNALLAAAGYNKELDVEIEDQFRLATTDFAHTMHNWTTRLGTTFAVNEHFAVSLGAKFNYLSRQVSIQPQLQIYRPSSSQYWEASKYFESKSNLLEEGSELAEAYKGVAEDCTSLSTDPVATNHSAMGIAPIIGLDYRLGKVNMGAKYEFQTIIEANEWVDFKLPSNLSLGLDWAILDNLNVAFGGTVYFRTNDNYGNCGDIKPKDISGQASLSISYSPLKQLLLSVGQTYETYSGYWYMINNEDIELPGLYRHTTSLGCAYSITDKLQLNFGGSIGYAPIRINENANLNIFANGEALTTVNCKVYFLTHMMYNAAVGVNYHF